MQISDRLVYVGDFIAIVFALRAAEVLGGQPVLAAVDAMPSTLVPDPHYAYLRRDRPELAQSADSSYLECGRVASPNAIIVDEAWICADVSGLDRDATELGLWDHVRYWQVPDHFAETARRFGAIDLHELRLAVGRRLVDEFFEPRWQPGA